MIRTALSRFLRSYIEDRDTGCWLWLGSLDNDGYGRIRLTRKQQVLSHRFSYETFVGPIPHELTIDHLCRRRCCVNPAHLEAVTQRENTHRGDTFSAANAAKTHCPNGHPYDCVRPYRRRGRVINARRCSLCVNARAREKYAQAP